MSELVIKVEVWKTGEHLEEESSMRYQEKLSEAVSVVPESMSGATGNNFIYKDGDKAYAVTYDARIVVTKLPS